MYLFRDKNIYESYNNVINEILKNGAIYQTIHGKVKELMPIAIEIEIPFNNILMLPGREHQIILNLAELLWRLGGRDDIKFMKKYMIDERYHTRDGIIWTGAYGKRFFDFHGINQFELVLKKIKNNRYVREGIISIYDPVLDSEINLKGIPCFNQILVAINKSKKLDMFVSMRANDAYNYFGGSNYFICTSLQSIFSYWLGVETGRYYHYVSSMELFERDFKLSEASLNNEMTKKIFYENTIELKPDFSYEQLKHFLKECYEIEDTFEDVTKYKSIWERIDKLESNYFKNILKVLMSYRLVKNNEKSIAKQVLESIDNCTIKTAALYWYQNVIKEEDE